MANEWTAERRAKFRATMRAKALARQGEMKRSVQRKHRIPKYVYLLEKGRLQRYRLVIDLEKTT